MWSSGIRARVRIDYVLCPIFRASGHRTPLESATEAHCRSPNTLPPQDWNRVLSLAASDVLREVESGLDR